jgi:hypothetical protein
MAVDAELAPGVIGEEQEDVLQERKYKIRDFFPQKKDYATVMGSFRESPARKSSYLRHENMR